MKGKTILGFGSFDGFHEGHRYFIQELKKLGERVIVVVAPDEVIDFIKKQRPRYSLQTRIGAVQKEFTDVEVAEGDQTLGGWEVLKKYKPDIIGVGYDQNGLREALEKSGIKPFPEIIVIDSHRPEKYKSSLI